MSKKGEFACGSITVFQPCIDLSKLDPLGIMILAVRPGKEYTALLCGHCMVFYGICHIGTLWRYYVSTVSHYYIELYGIKAQYGTIFGQF